MNRVLGAAVDAFMAERQSENGRPAIRQREQRESRNGGGFGTVGAVAVGAALAVTARAAYSRVRRKLDLEQVADAVEQRLSG